ncbi:uncharacterized protein LOC109789379 [Cajanus cajan]|uniref:uncharacterized protein LOC109789379 n=1 Tax=Cajanus cajan TaxID=3821 RepID=UPI00098D9F27|nr:uncharacterized protein LOC109789379 [Cajanus cajan]
METNWATAEAARVEVLDDYRGLSEFRKGNPPQFTGVDGPEVVDQWIEKMEKIFMVMHCLEERKLVYAVYMLVGEASFWWKDSARYAKEAEFLRLQQGNMSVQEYVVKFEHLARYYSQAITEAWRCRKFSEGLRYELKKTIVPMGIVEFPVIVEMEKSVARFEGGNRVAKGPEGSSGFGRGKHPQKRPSQFQKGNANKKPMGTNTIGAVQSAEAETSSELVKGKGKADGNDISILFDSGASHFISYECVARLNLVVSSLCVDLVISTLASGMDWLFANKILIDCSEKRLIFPTVEHERFISSGQVDGLLKGGALGFIIPSFINVENEKLLNSIVVVKDFSKVFPDDVPGLPPK